VTPVRDVVIRGDVRSHERQQGAPQAGEAGTSPHVEAQGVSSQVRLLVIGAPSAATRFVDEYNANGGRGRMRLAVSLDTSQLDQLEASIAEHRPERIVLVERRCSGDQIQQLIECCLRHDLPMQVPEPSHDGDPVAVLSGPDRVAYAVHPSAVHPREYRVKRIVDVVAAGGLLAVLSPFFAAVAVLGKLGSPGPTFYISWRVGVGEDPFPCYKFRTMHVGADVLQEELESRNEADGCLFKIRDDPRVTRVGRFLRRTSLDELPQLANVLRGEMSLVGPRPLPLRDVSLMDSRFRSRHAVLPGMTGLWQIRGRSSLTAERMMQLDMDYIRNWSLGLDLRILLRTAGVIVRGKGAY
jgi:lipopolysaccharide/colanic/teichoic acid biosynthesis glycosyltransferase